MVFLSVLALPEEYRHEDIPIARSVLTSVGTTFPLHKSSLCCVVSGKVNEVMVDVGSFVSKGQVLLNLDQRFFLIEIARQKAALCSAQSDLKDSKRNFDRMRKLWERTDGKAPSISQKRFEDTELQYEESVAAEKVQEETLRKAEENLLESVLRAPYDGVITMRAIHPGEPVSAQQPLGLQIEYINTLYVEFSVPQTYLDKIHKGQEVFFSVEGVLKDEVAGTIDVIYPHVDTQTRAIKCRAFLDNKEHKIPSGVLVKVQIPVERK